VKDVVTLGNFPLVPRLFFINQKGKYMTKPIENRRARLTAFRLSQQEEEPLRFIADTLDVTPSAAIRRAIQYYALFLANTIQPEIETPSEKEEEEL
jgi:hypothetical protein